MTECMSLSPRKPDTRPLASFPRERERGPESSRLGDPTAVIPDGQWDGPPDFDANCRRLLKRRSAHAAQTSRTLGLPSTVPQSWRMMSVRPDFARFTGKRS